MSEPRTYYEEFYNIPAHYPRWLKNILVAGHMFFDKGMTQTLVNIYKRVITKFHFKFVDGPANAKLPETTLNNERLETMQLAKSAGGQDINEIFYGPNPRLTLLWALDALKIDFSRFAFLDCGSGLGYAMFTAALRPFQKIIGVEFARELYERSLPNLEAIKKLPEAKCRDLSAVHQSILDYAIPDTPLVVFMSNPFKEDIMLPWMAALSKSYQTNKRPILIVYANPTLSGLFNHSPQWRVIEPGIFAQLRFYLASPYNVALYQAI